MEQSEGTGLRSKCSSGSCCLRGWMMMRLRQQGQYRSRRDTSSGIAAGRTRSRSIPHHLSSRPIWTFLALPSAFQSLLSLSQKTHVEHLFYESKQHLEQPIYMEERSHTCPNFLLQLSLAMSLPCSSFSLVRLLSAIFFVKCMAKSPCELGPSLWHVPLHSFHMSRSYSRFTRASYRGPFFRFGLRHPTPGPARTSQ